MTLLDSHRELLAICKSDPFYNEQVIQRAEAAQQDEMILNAKPGWMSDAEIEAIELKDLDITKRRMRKASAEIERLQALVPRWRKVEEELPADGDFVLLQIKSGSVVFSHFNSGRFGLVDSARGYPIIDGVGKWQPLPAPPQPEER